MNLNQPGSMSRPGRTAGLVAFVLAGGIALGLAGQSIVRAGESRSAARTVAPRGPLPADEQSVVDLFTRVSPSVVYISTTIDVNRGYFGWGGRRTSVEEVPFGTGTGFIWDDQGHIVTNFHVISNGNENDPGIAKSAKVKLASGEEFDATLVGVQPDEDIAVLKIDAPSDKLTPITIGSSSDLKVGQSVFAIGNPFGLDHTLTRGIVSALDRDIESMVQSKIAGVIQTDAAINPGNSGGPLLDSAGRLIGMNTAIRSGSSGTSSGVGFAVPVDPMFETVNFLIDPKKPPQAILGVVTVPARVAEQLGIKQGLLIGSVAPGTAADKAGFHPTRVRSNGSVAIGDVLTEIAGRPVNTQSELRRALRQYKPGDTVEVHLIRGDAEQTMKVELSGTKSQD